MTENRSILTADTIINEAFRMGVAEVDALAKMDIMVAVIFALKKTGSRLLHSVLNLNL